MPPYGWWRVKGQRQLLMPSSGSATPPRVQQPCTVALGGASSHHPCCVAGLNLCAAVFGSIKRSTTSVPWWPWLGQAPAHTSNSGSQRLWCCLWNSPLQRGGHVLVGMAWMPNFPSTIQLTSLCLCAQSAMGPLPKQPLPAWQGADMDCHKLSGTPGTPIG